MRTSHNPIAQVGKRIIELENVGSHINHKNIKTKVSTNQKDSWFLLNNGDYACIKDTRNNGEFSCDVIHPIHIQNLFTEPCESKCLNIGVSNNHVFKRKLVTLKDLKRKVVCMSYNNNFIVVPLLHDVYFGV